MGFIRWFLKIEIMTNTTTNDPQPILRLQHISKSFPGVQALQDVDFDVYPGEVHALLGENGAGKSTLIKIMSGAIPPSAGEIILEGETHSAMTPIQSLSAGIETVYQDLAVAPHSISPPTSSSHVSFSCKSL